ncbi:uncharacterized protein LOC127749637 isoform X2 [Frankliniella occidentalis]|uniref:Uncharacterized protein LOC127749637 isoform X2 n=1 Tax=Frankliniella occidentalis TaxID=133901 RepID=A0A9C6U7E3_FRAOC|nr:uncharacterized protein LOC127749637 isoform X2 [Frankliniella occidentalis]
MESRQDGTPGTVDTRRREKAMAVNSLVSLLRGAIVYALLPQGSHEKAINSFAGPYVAYADRFINCEQQYAWRMYLRATHFNPQKPNELQLLNGNLTATKGFDDNCWAKVYLDIRNNNQWKENAFVFEFKDKACTTLRTNLPGPANIFFGKGNGERKPCVIPPGVHKADQEPVDWTFPKFPVMPYGHYKFRLNSNANEIILCLQVECHIIPKLK